MANQKPFIPKDSGGVYQLASDPTKCFLLVGTRTKTTIFHDHGPREAHKKTGVSCIYCKYDPSIDFSSMTLDDFVNISLKEQVNDWDGYEAYYVTKKVPEASALLHKFEIPPVWEFLFRCDRRWNDSMPFDDTHKWEHVNLVRIVNLEIPMDSNEEVIPEGAVVGVIGRDEKRDQQTVVVGVTKGLSVYTMTGRRPFKGALLIENPNPKQLEIRQKIIALHGLKF